MRPRAPSCHRGWNRSRRRPARARPSARPTSPPGARGRRRDAPEAEHQRIGREVSGQARSVGTEVADSVLSGATHDGNLVAEVTIGRPHPARSARKRPGQPGDNDGRPCRLRHGYSADRGSTPSSGRLAECESCWQQRGPPLVCGLLDRLHPRPQQRLVASNRSAPGSAPLEADQVVWQRWRADQVTPGPLISRPPTVASDERVPCRLPPWQERS